MLSFNTIRLHWQQTKANFLSDRIFDTLRWCACASAPVSVVSLFRGREAANPEFDVPLIPWVRD